MERCNLFANLLNKQWLTVIQTRTANNLLVTICVMTFQIWVGLLAGVCDGGYESADFSVWIEEGWAKVLCMNASAVYQVLD
jgi:hypothetical protein